MLAWLEGIDNGRQKTRNHGYDVIVGGELFTGLLRSPSQTCHAKLQNSNQQAPDATSFFPTVDAYRKQLGSRLLSEKSGIAKMWRSASGKATYD